MIFKMKLLIGLIVLIGNSLAYPVSQPVYPNSQYISAQTIPTAVQYRQQPQQTYVQSPQYITAQQPARPVYESDRGQGLQKYSSQIQQQPIQQVLLATNVDRQVQKIGAQVGGPHYLQQIQAAQQQGQAQEAFSAAQRKATSQTLNRQIQPVPQPQYLRELAQPTQVKYARPAAQGYRQQAVPQQQHQQQQQVQREQPEDYDPNPSYQFGFDVNDDLYTNYQNRKEQREGNKITGSYSVVDSDGFIRTVTYTADPKEGFKAEVTRQPTDIVVKIPKPDPQFARQPQQYIQNVPQERGQQVQQQYQYE